MKYREEVFAGTLLFLLSFFPHYEIFVLLIYAYASYFRLKYFSPFVAALLIPISPIHALFAILPYPFLFFDREFGLSYYISLAFSLFTQNYLLMLFLAFLDRRGLISAGLSLLVLTAFIYTQDNYLVTLGNIAFMLILAGVISTLIEERISKRTALVVIPSAVLVYYHLYFLLPLLLIFSPWTSLLFAYFNPYLAIISLAELKRKIKFGELIPSIFSVLYPPLALTLVKSIRKVSSFALLVPLAVELYFMITFSYNELAQIEIITLFLLLLRYAPSSNLYARLLSFLKNNYNLLVGVLLFFIGVYYYFFDLLYLALFSISAIVITFSYAIDIRGLPIAFLSLVNPVAGLGLSNRKYAAFFLLVPLIGYIMFNIPVYTYIIAELGVLFSFIDFRNVREKMIYFVIGLIYFAYSIYLFLIGEVIETTPYLLISLLFLILFNVIKKSEEIKINEMISLLALSYPFPLLSPIFVYLRKKLDPYIVLLLEGILVIFLVKVNLLNYIMLYNLLNEGTVIIKL